MATKRRKYKLDQDIADNARFLIDRGLTVVKTADVLGVSEAAIYMLRKHGYNYEAYHADSAKRLAMSKEKLTQKEQPQTRMEALQSHPGTEQEQILLEVRNCLGSLSRIMKLLVVEKQDSN